MLLDSSLDDILSRRFDEQRVRVGLWLNMLRAGGAVAWWVFAYSLHWTVPLWAVTSYAMLAGLLLGGWRFVPALRHRPELGVLLDIPCVWAIQTLGALPASPERNQRMQEILESRNTLARVEAIMRPVAQGV